MPELPLVPVTGPVLMPDGSVPVNGRVLFSLSGPDTANGVVVGLGPIRRNLDATGNFTEPLSLYRCTEGLRGRHFKVTLVSEQGAFAYPNVQTGEAASYTFANLIDTPVPDAPGEYRLITPAELAQVTAEMATATTQAGIATAAASTALTARDLAIIAAAAVGSYTSTALGIAATTNGQSFFAPSGVDVGLYVNVAGVASLVGAQPSKAAFDKLTTTVLIDELLDQKYGLVFRATGADGRKRITGGVRQADGVLEFYRAEFAEATVGGVTIIGTRTTDSLTDYGGIPVVDQFGRVQGVIPRYTPPSVTPTPEPDPGTINDGYTPMPLIPKLSGTAISAIGPRGEVACVDASPFAVSAVAPGTDKAVRAVINRAGFGALSTVACAPGRGVMVPDADRVLHVHYSTGQSLSVGWTASPTLAIAGWTEQAHDDALMFNADVRMGMLGAAPLGTLDPNTLTSFVPLEARQGASANSGQAPIEGATDFLTREARDQAGVRYRSLTFVSGLGATNYAGLKKGTLPYSNFIAGLTKAKALADAQGLTLVLDYVFVKHGEGNQNTSTYAANLTEWQADIDADARAITGQTVPVHMILSQFSSFIRDIAAGDDPYSTTAPLALHNSSAVHHLAGPDYPHAEFYVTDTESGGQGWVHFKNQGSFLIGEVAGRAARDALWSPGRKSKIVQITSAVRTGTSVVLNWEVPVPPLVLDTVLVPERDVKGFRYRDSAGLVAISAVTLTGPAQITLTLGATPNGTGEQVLYGMSPQNAATNTLAEVCRGNVRDSDPTLSRVDGRRLYNWGVHHPFNVTVS